MENQRLIICIFKRWFVLQMIICNMIGIKGSKRLERTTDLNNIVNQLTLNALILMKFNFMIATRDRYNLSTELVNILDSLTIDNILENFKDITDSKKSQHKTKKIENINTKMKNQLFKYKRSPPGPIIEYKLNELKKTISTTVHQSSPVIIPLPGTGGSRLRNSMKISYNDQYIMNKNNYILLVHRHK